MLIRAAYTGGQNDQKAVNLPQGMVHGFFVISRLVAS